jgi:hypothetical protein
METHDIALKIGEAFDLAPHSLLSRKLMDYKISPLLVH